jgi:hypothetical protein
VLTAELTGRKPGFSLAEDTDALLVGKTLLHGGFLKDVTDIAACKYMGSRSSCNL